MSSRRWKGAAVCEEDIHQALQAIQQECGCSCRVWYSISNDPYHTRLKVCAEAYTESEGVRIGVARYEDVWSSGHTRSLLGVMLLALHHVYQRAYELAHAT